MGLLTCPRTSDTVYCAADPAAQRCSARAARRGRRLSSTGGRQGTGVARFRCEMRDLYVLAYECNLPIFKSANRSEVLRLTKLVAYPARFPRTSRGLYRIELKKKIYNSPTVSLCSVPRVGLQGAPRTDRCCCSGARARPHVQSTQQRRRARGCRDRCETPANLGPWRRRVAQQQRPRRAPRVACHG